MLFRSHVFDPFVGGSVRGIVIAAQGHYYWGADIRHEQVFTRPTQANKLAFCCVFGLALHHIGDGHLRTGGVRRSGRSSCFHIPNRWNGQHLGELHCGCNPSK